MSLKPTAGPGSTVAHPNGVRPPSFNPQNSSTGQNTSQQNTQQNIGLNDVSGLFGPAPTSQYQNPSWLQQQPAQQQQAPVQQQQQRGGGGMSPGAAAINTASYGPGPGEQAWNEGLNNMDPAMQQQYQANQAAGQWYAENTPARDAPGPQGDGTYWDAAQGSWVNTDGTPAMKFGAPGGGGGFGGLGGIGGGGGGGNLNFMMPGNQPNITEQQVFSPQDIQRMLTGQLERNAMEEGSRNLEAQNRMGAQGMQRASGALAGNERMNAFLRSMQDATAQREIPLQAAMPNAQHLLATQQAREGQYSNRIGEDLGYQQVNASLMSPLLSALGALL